MNVQIDELRKLCYEKAKVKYGYVDARIEQELEFIGDTRIPECLLWMYKCFSNPYLDKNFWQGSGTVNNSILCYLLGLTNIDPLEYGLPYQFAYRKKGAFIFDSVTFRTSKRQLDIFLALLTRDDYRKIVNDEFPKITSRYVISSNGTEALAGIYLDEEVNGLEIIMRDKECSTFSFVIEAIKNLTVLEQLQFYTRKVAPNACDENDNFMQHMYWEDENVDEVFGQEIHNFLFARYRRKYALKSFEDWVACFNRLANEGCRIQGDIWQSCNLWVLLAKRYAGTELKQIASVFGSREDVYAYLYALDVPASIGLDLCEAIRKGKIRHSKKLHYQEELLAYNIPKWFWKTCCQVMYLAPKAEGINRANTLLKLAWYKYYYLNEFQKVVGIGYGG